MGVGNRRAEPRPAWFRSWRTADCVAIADMVNRAGDPAGWADQGLWAPCFRVEVVGTTGVGDVVIAGFVAGLLRGLPPTETLTAAVVAGACNVEAADALSGIPDAG